MAHPSLEDYIDHHTPNIGLAPGTPLVSYPVWQTWEIEKQAREDWWALDRRWEARQRRLEREREAREAEAAEVSVAYVPSDYWAAVGMCESGGDPTTNTGNGYYGLLQFDMTTWIAFGGLEFASRPDLASAAEQIAVAERVTYDAWPNCP
jgi:hypothetical protein